MKSKKTGFITLGVIGLFIVAFVGGRMTGSTSAPMETAEEHAAHTDAGPEVWTCSMHPQIQLPKPGKCPICFMDLIPLEAGDDGGGEREISVSPYAAKLMELETAEASRRLMSAEVRMVGKVDYDETRVSTISAWLPGRLDRLFVDYTGIPVKQGEHLAELYSPELLTAQEELIQALQTLEKIKNSQSSLLLETAERTVVAAREKLRLWGFTPGQIAETEARGTPSDHMTIYSPAAGIIIHKNAQEGMYVKTGTKIYTIADLSKVWIQLDAYESDLNWLRYGGTVEFTTEAHPGRTFEGTISFIDPVINPSTRTAKVRVIVANPSLELKPGMFVRAVARPKVAQNGKVMNAELAGKWISPMHPEIVKDEPGSCDVCGMPLVTAESLGYVTENASHAPLLIPVSAALKTGRRAVVYVERPEKEKPTYEGREVQLGARLGNFYVVESGLDEGERVVTRGAFKLDAELQIRAKPSMMSGGTDHNAHEMTMETAEEDLSPMEAPAEFRDQLQEVMEAYFSVHQALSGDAPVEAGIRAAAVKEKLDRVNMGLLQGDAHRIWMDHLKKLNAPLVKLTKEPDVGKQRELFYQLSRQLAKTVQVFPVDQPVYQAFCPMAFNDAGAIWLQKSEEVLNPYFGDMMLRCGEIQKVFENTTTAQNGKSGADQSPTKAGNAQTICPVMGNPVNKEIFVDYHGKRIYFCCAGCDSTFMENPDHYLQQMNAEGIELEEAAHNHAH
ncbi:efflux RND transporter periplasmic adaptor subunit [Pontiella sp.]|uniref:efflux RND transporter periplasmic adaptor subunit n=1 Tax=Pontiella sp. TaxID=2837462 RepID=UPI00356498D3